MSDMPERCVNKREEKQNDISRLQLNGGKIMGIFDWAFGDTDNEDAQLEDMIFMDMDDEDD